MMLAPCPLVFFSDTVYIGSTPGHKIVVVVVAVAVVVGDDARWRWRWRCAVVWVVVVVGGCVW